MTSLRERFDDAATAAPPSRLSSRDVYAAAWRRRRARQRWTAAAAGGLTVLVVAAVVTVAGNRAPQSGPIGTVSAGTVTPRPSAPSTEAVPTVPVYGLQSPVAGEGKHLYVQWAPFECENLTKHGCPGRLLGSDDNGATWTERYRGTIDDISAPAPGVVQAFFDGDPDLDMKHFSTDGGRTWKRVRPVDGTVATVPAGGWATCTEQRREPGEGGQYQCVLRGVDPRTGDARKLVNQPGLQVQGITSPPTGAGLWVTGTAPDGHLGIAVSRDGGKTWLLRVFAESDPADPGYTSLATLDGTNAYAVVMTGHPRRVVMYRSTDGGQSWTLADPEHTVPYKDHGQDNYLAADGTHVIRTVHEKLSEWYAGTGGTYRAPAPVTGLVDHEGFWPILTAAPGRYLTNDLTALYTSPDGLHWTRLPVVVPPG